MSPVNVPEANNEVIPGAPSRRRRFRLSDEENTDDPRSIIGERDLAGIRRRYSISESVKLRWAGEFERAPDGRVDEVAIFEAYFKAGSRGGIPSLIAEVSSYFAFSPFQLTPSTWRTLIAIQVLGELQGIPFGISEVLYSYSIVPLKDNKGFYQIWSRDGEPIVNEHPRGVRGEFPHDDLWNRRYMFMKVNGATSYPQFWRSIGGIPRAPISSIYGEYHRVKSWRGRQYTLPVHLPATSSRPSFQERLDRDRVFDPYQRIPPHEEILFLRVQLRNMASHQAWLTQRTRAFARWELMRDWLENNVNHRDLDREYCLSLSSGGGIWTGGFPSMMPSPNGFGP
ncbi:hypothetical protein Bca101_067751 [Brassica carinata]